MIFTSPLKYLALTNDFSKNHVANDLGWNSKQGGSKVDMFAMADGVVEDVYETEESGKIIVCKFEESFTWYSVYKHCSKILVEKGTQIKRGQPIAKMGNTGSAASGNHLHIELLSCPLGTKYLKTDAFRKKYALNPREIFFYTDENVLSPKTQDKFTKMPVEHLKVGDKVKIIKTGNSQASGKGKTAKGIGWKRQIKAVLDGQTFPYKVGNALGTTGFYQEDALEKL